MNCNQCGTEVPMGSGFCPKCGSMVSIMSANNMPMQNTVGEYNGIKKSGGNNNLIIIFVALVMILVVILIAVLFTGKDKENVKKTEDQQTEVVLNKDPKEELAVEVAEEFIKSRKKVSRVWRK